MRKEYKRMYLFVGVIIIYSVFKIVSSGIISMRTVQEILFLILPMVYAQLIINNWNKRQIENAMKCGVIIAFVGYVTSLNMSFRTIYNGILMSSFSDSYSDLESFTYCGIALAFFVYFAYYKKQKLFLIISGLFVIMTFKRLFMVIAAVLFIISLFELRNMKVSKKVINITIFLLFALAIIYYYLMHPEMVSYIETKYGFDVSKFTMTRSDRFRWLYTSDYVSYGFGSSTEYMYNRFYGALEMDMCKIIIELGFLPVFILIHSYIKLAEKNMYTFVFMGLMVMNLIFSSGLTGTFAWCIIFIAISSINVYPSNEVKYRRKIKK